MKSQELNNKLNKILKSDIDLQRESLLGFCKDHSLEIEDKSTIPLKPLLKYVQAYIQTQATVETVKYAKDTLKIAKWSCLFAAVAAGCSLIVVIVANHKSVSSILLNLFH